MNDAKHTPGPWTIEEYGDEDAPALVIHKDSETRVCFMATPGSHGDPAKIEADARLIAAAPDLYEALDAAADLLQFYLDTYGEIEGRSIRGTLKDCAAALTKASGERQIGR